MKNKKSMITVISIMCLMLVGCSLPFGEVDSDQTSIFVNKKDGITQIIVESFDQSYYNADELRGEIEGKISQYCQQASAEEAVVLKDLTLSEDKQIKVKLEYASDKEYTGFNEKMLFVGTVSQAYQNGYSFEDLKGVDGTSLSAQALLEKGDMHIVIMEEAQQMKTPTKIAYYSEGVSLLDEKTAMNGNEGQISFVVYE